MGGGGGGSPVMGFRTLSPLLKMSENSSMSFLIGPLSGSSCVELHSSLGKVDGRSFIFKSK